MKSTIWAAAFAILGAGAATAQDGDFRRDFERRMRELEERFRAEKGNLEREFRERFQPNKPDGGPGRLEDLVKKLIERVERLEKRLEENAPKAFGEFRRLMPRGEDGGPDFEKFRREFERFMPRFEDRDFRFDFRRSEPPEKKKDEAPEEKQPKKKKVESHEEKKEEKAPPKKAEGTGF